MRTGIILGRLTLRTLSQIFINVKAVLENDNNAAHYLRMNPDRPRHYFDAQWNDDIHHVLYVLLTGVFSVEICLIINM